MTKKTMDKNDKNFKRARDRYNRSRDISLLKGRRPVIIKQAEIIDSEIGSLPGCPFYIVFIFPEGPHKFFELSFNLGRIPTYQEFQFKTLEQHAVFPRVESCEKGEADWHNVLFESSTELERFFNDK